MFIVLENINSQFFFFFFFLQIVNCFLISFSQHQFWNSQSNKYVVLVFSVPLISQDPLPPEFSTMVHLWRTNQKCLSSQGNFLIHETELFVMIILSGVTTLSFSILPPFSMWVPWEQILFLKGPIALYVMKYYIVWDRCKLLNTVLP